MAENLNDDGWATIAVPLPPELVALNIGPDLKRFFDAMIYKLRRNHHKGRWEDIPLQRALDATFGEFTELATAVENGSTAEIWMEAADVANQALITASIAHEAETRETKPTEDRHETVHSGFSPKTKLSDSDGPTRRSTDEPPDGGERTEGFRDRRISGTAETVWVR